MTIRLRTSSLVLLGSLTLPLILWRWLVQMPPGGIEDDGYFYSQVAYNIAVSGRASFDGIHATDGFHLLWGYLLGVVSWVASGFSTSKSVHLYLHAVVSVGVLLTLAVRFGQGRSGMLLLLALGLMCSLPMETPLGALLYLALMDRVIAYGAGGEPTPRRGHGPLVVLPAFLVLTRIDMAIMPLVGGAVLLLRRRSRTYAWLTVGVVVGVLVQLVLAKAVGGAWVSVSSVLKAAESGFGQSFVGGLHYPGRLLLLAVLLPWSGWVAWKHGESRGDRGPLFLWLGACAFIVPHLLVSLMRPWYYAPGLLVYAVTLLRVGSVPPAAHGRTARIAVGVAWLGVAAFVAGEARAFPRFQEETRRIESFLEEVRREVPAGEPIFQDDGSGYVGYFLDRAVVNGDGLMNTHEYAERLLSNDLAGYLDEVGIEWIITNQTVGDRVVEVGGLVVDRSEVEPVVRKEGDPAGPFTDFVLWRRRTFF